jgi:5-oxoprolinase (ATP-hydrolysing) subunit C
LVTLEVVEGGLHTTVQDVVGRRRWAHLGVPEGGAADPWSARLANRLVGNDVTAALLEATVGGPTLRFGSPAVVAVVGNVAVDVDGIRAPASTPLRLRPGSLVRIGPGRDARCYVAVAGGLRVPVVLGSAATDTRSGFGGHEGRPLRPGDRIAIGQASASLARAPIVGPPDGRIRLVPGPHATPAAVEVLTAAEWRIGAEADRTGARLDGPAVRIDRHEIPSMGLPLGAIQVPPDGRPIVMLADRPVTGGYGVPAIVIRADIGRIARAMPGELLRFTTIAAEAAVAAWRRAMEELAALEALEGPEDDELAWVGAHE